MNSGDYKIKVLAIYKYLLATDRDHPITIPVIRDNLQKDYNISTEVVTVYSDLKAIEIVDPRLKKVRGRRGQYNRYWIEKEENDNG